MPALLALYRGKSVGTLKLSASTTEPTMVVDFATRMLSTLSNPELDAVPRELEQGRWRALQLVKNEARG